MMIASCPPAPLSADRQRLAARYYPLARALARRYRLRRRYAGHAEEFLSRAGLALVRAAWSFDPDRGVNFCTYARRRILGALADLRRELAGVSHGSGRTRAVFRRPTNLSALGVMGRDHLAFESPVGETYERQEHVDSLLRGLPPLNAEICRLLYFEDLSLSDTARRLGRSPSWVRHVHQQTLDLLASR